MRKGSYFLILLLAVSTIARADDLRAKFIGKDVSQPNAQADYWAAVEPITVSLVAQPMINPRPKETTTSAVGVRSVHDGEWIAFRLSWKDSEKSEAGKIGQFSDGAAIQFPIRPSTIPPPVFMGAKGDPVHIFHWRAQYQRDAQYGKPQMKDLYPNLNIDVYPMDHPDWGSYEKASEGQREQFSPGLVSGNPQAYKKTGVDEIYAEGFSTSSVQVGHKSRAIGDFKEGGWNLVISRPLETEGGSMLKPGADGFIAFAIWQGGAGEVGSRKSVTMAWTSLIVEAEGS